MADGRPRITVTSARTATASLVERRGEGVDRRAAHQGAAGERLAREFTERRVERRVELPPPPVEAAVETVSAAEVLAGVAEYGPNNLAKCNMTEGQAIFMIECAAAHSTHSSSPHASPITPRTTSYLKRVRCPDARGHAWQGHFEAAPR